MPRTTRRSLIIAALAVTSVVSTASPAAAAGGTGTVTGVVTRATDHAPLAGATVTAETPQGQVLASTTAGTDGTYTLTNVPSGYRVVCADGSGVVSAAATAGWLRDCAYAAPVRVGRGTVTAHVDRSERLASAVGGVVSDPSGAPLAGVAVAFGDDDIPDQRTGADGRYRVVFDAANVSYVDPYYDGTAATGGVSTVGYLSASHTFPPGQYSLQPRPGRTYVLNQKLQPAAVFSGRVTGPDGAGVGGVQIGAAYTNARTTSAADGSWTLSGLPSHTKVYLGFAADAATGPSPTGYLSQCWRTAVSQYSSPCEDVAGAAPLVTPTGTTTSGLDVRLHAAGGITGRVTDTLGRPVPGAEIISYGGGYVHADNDGVYVVTRLTTGLYYRVCTNTQYQLSGAPFPNPDGYVDACWTDDGETDGSTIAVREGQLVTGKDIVLAGRGGISGGVLAPDGTPADDVAVDVTGPEDLRGASTSTDGSFRVSDLEAGTYTLCFSFTPYADRPASAPYGYGRQCVETTVQDSAVTTLPAVTMSLGGEISGKVTDFYGFAMGEVYVSIRDTTTGADVADAHLDGYDPTGAWSLDGIPPGVYTVCFQADYAYRYRDNHRPPNGYASQCWRRRTLDQPPTPVTVVGGAATTGIDAALRVNPGD